MTQAEITHEMWSLYQSGISMPEIGRRYGCTKGAVSHRFKRAGLSARVIEADPALVAIALERHDSGESVASIARDIGRHPKNVRRWLRQRDVDTANRANVHCLSEVDLETRTAACAECGPTRIYSTEPGAMRCALATLAGRLENPWWNGGRAYLRHRGTECESCRFAHGDARVFDVHHKDEDHSNNDPANLATLCPRCHRVAHVEGLPPIGDTTNWMKIYARPYLRYRRNRCNRCPFTHADVRVFDVHHRNHDHDDNREENLETLCPTCHRLEHLGLTAAVSTPQT